MSEAKMVQIRPDEVRRDGKTVTAIWYGSDVPPSDALIWGTFEYTASANGPSTTTFTQGEWPRRKYPPAIRWSDATGFDEAYDHDWVDHECSDCKMSYSSWDGFPCRAKAEQVSFWIPRADR